MCTGKGNWVTMLSSRKIYIQINDFKKESNGEYKVWDNQPGLIWTMFWLQSGESAGPTENTDAGVK